VADVVMALGSDVPFLARADVLALAWGRGERMLALPPLPRRHVVLLQPAFGVATAAAYEWLAAERADRPPGPVPSVLPFDALKSWDGVAAVADNDFEAVVERRHPEIAALRGALESRGATLARMSGSGSTVFGVFDRAPDAAELERATGCRVIATHTAARVVPVEVGG
jgi:4-diphosphocytidyl-2-C-methyl-D-erythritol kinase